MKGVNQGTLVTLDDALRAIDNLRMLLRTLSVFIGEGTPEGKQDANRGALFLRTDGGASTSLYIKESGDGTKNGWRAV